MKRVLLIVVDACSSRVLGPLIDRNRVPTIARLVARGSLHLNCISIFPSITPAATTTIVTGHYPREHGIAGMSWYDDRRGSVAYFGDDIWTVAQRGFGDFLRGFLARLNDDLLRAPTIFEIVEDRGRTAGSFNHLIFKGRAEHPVNVPWVLRLLPTVPSTLVVRGPSTLCLGDFVSRRPRRPAPSTEGGVFNRFGMDDDGTAGFLLDLEGVASLPDFSVAYFANNDYQSHEKGPGKAAGTLEHVDALLGRVFDAWGGLDHVLDELSLVVTADHSQSDVLDDASAAIQLDELLDDWRLGDPASGWEEADQLMVCPNMRAAEVYLQRPTSVDVQRVARSLLADARVDHVMWRTPADPDDRYRVATADRGELRFQAKPDGRARDAYGGRWTCAGEAEALDMRVAASGEIEYGEYPNALERIAAGIGQEGGLRMWVTARPGYEFELSGQAPHRGGGSHGSLHALDSVVPLLVVGAPEGVAVPVAPRLVDVTPLCLQALGLHPDVMPGASRARALHV